jgi:hypothetical protein
MVLMAMMNISIEKINLQVKALYDYLNEKSGMLRQSGLQFWFWNRRSKSPVA